jgi:dihydroorotate dehydrogenase
MEKQFLRNRWETLEGEHLKTAAELAVHGLARHNWGQSVLELVSGGERIEDPRLHTEVAGLEFENPVMVGAGWDKKGRCLDGLYYLGFSGVEVGSVLIFPQRGNDRPRLWVDKETKGVGLNRLGFNSLGVETVEANLTAQNRPGVTGISVGKNKLLPDELAPWAHKAVVERLYDVGDYFVINVSSPNTPGLRDQLKPDPLRDNIQAVKRALTELGGKPLFIKTTVDLALEDLDNVIEVCLDEGVDGMIDSNTTIDDDLKARYGWRGETGGLSGNDPEFRRRANERMKYITRTTRDTGLQRIGVGGISDAATAIERLEAGAQVIQVVTGIRQRKGRIARDINKGILEHLDRTGAGSVEDIIGVAA